MNADIKMYDLAALSASSTTASAPWGRPSLAAVPDRFYMPLHSSVGSGLADWQAVRFIYSQWVSESPCHVRPWNTQKRKQLLSCTANIHQLTMVGLKCWMVNIRQSVDSRLAPLHSFKNLFDSCWELFKYILMTRPSWFFGLSALNSFQVSFLCVSFSAQSDCKLD